MKPLEKLKAEDLEPGTLDVDEFKITLCREVFCTEREPDYFEVMVSQLGPNYDNYINLVEDERFKHFAYIEKLFSRKLNNNDLVEYNSYVNTCFLHEQMPSFKLSRHSIMELIDKCKDISKKIKRTKKKEKQNAGR